MSLDEIIKNIRKELNITQEQLARDLDISYATLNRWENGHNIPNRLTRKAIAAYCSKKGMSSKIIIALEQYKGAN